MGIVMHIPTVHRVLLIDATPFLGDEPAVEADDFKDYVIVYGCSTSSNLTRASSSGP